MAIQRLYQKMKNTVNEEYENVYLIVGLGNPGREHAHNRHNVGFMVVDRIAGLLGVEFTRMQSKALVTKGSYQGQRVILAKPRTFMNLSGQAVGPLLRFYKLPVERLLVIFDDADLDYEVIRLRPEGGSSGQKGMKSIIQTLGTQAFPRLRVGIGRPPGRMKTPDYVLQDFSKVQQFALPFLLDRAAQAALSFVAEGIEAAMNEFNQKPA